MLDSGRWAKHARKHYVHDKGAEIVWSPKRHLWLVHGTGAWPDGRGWEVLREAAHAVDLVYGEKSV